MEPEEPSTYTPQTNCHPITTFPFEFGPTTSKNDNEGIASEALIPTQHSTKNVDPYKRSPSFECLQHFFNGVRSKEHQTLVEEQFDQLVKQILENLSKGEPRSSIWENDVRIIFSLCKILNTSEHTKFVAVELHERYIRKMDVLLETFMTEMNYSLDKAILDKTEKNLREFPLLRVSSCIQIASKTYSYDHECRRVMPISMTQLSNAIQLLGGNKYSTKAIFASEQRVLQVLQFNLTFPIPLDVAELILIQLGLKEEEYRRAYFLVLNTLDFLYTKWSHVAQVFYKALTTAPNFHFTLSFEDFQDTIFQNKFLQGSTSVSQALVFLKLQRHPVFEQFKSLVKKKIDFNFIAHFTEAIYTCTKWAFDSKESSSLITSTSPLQNPVESQSHCKIDQNTKSMGIEANFNRSSSTATSNSTASSKNSESSKFTLQIQRRSSPAERNLL